MSMPRIPFRREPNVKRSTHFPPNVAANNTNILIPFLLHLKADTCCSGPLLFDVKAKAGFQTCFLCCIFTQASKRNKSVIKYAQR